VTEVLFVSTFLSATSNRGYTEDLVDRLERDGLVVHRTSTKPGRAARLADMLRATVALRREFDVAVVDVFSGAAFVWAEAVCLALRALGKPYVLTLHGGNLPVFAKRWPRRARRLLRGAARVTAPSEYMRDQMRAYRQDIMLVPNAVDTNVLRFAEREHVEPRLVWVRAFHEVYNPMLAVEALAIASRQLAGAKLTMVGPDKEDGSLAATKECARRLHVEDRVDIIGPVPKSNIPEHLARGDIFINTTNVDNTPISVLEAMGSGMCVVSTAVGGIPYLLEHERTALLVPRADAAAMGAAIERLVSDRSLARRISREARATALTHDWSIVLGKWQQLLGEVARA
jgi:glycosyltransferase involved in cell wall biosynthesis